MHATRHHHHSKENQFIRLETRRCTACWKCLDVCPEQALGKIEVAWHRHVRLLDDEACTGCKKCVRACESGALTYIYVSQSRAASPERADRVDPA